ncbi:VWA domain-containing protein [Aureitalea sp. L0-47]|uniref:VWA domain-containing protein n=1 Tax=Aureitalea sp. L0-47 TaxID=2816962 RepID=UPI002237617C|nr:VWA domain-containing protein [Aureitalea sp. L0-47]MCW5519499.1 VWA domain-containing protein [Aureitalea sp. L0-47]
MTAETVLYIIVAAVVAFAVAVFMYGYKAKESVRLRWIFGILRFFSLFALLLLIINPKFRSETYTVQKPKLPVLIDNSSSIAELEQDGNVTEFVEMLKNNSELNDKFDITYFSFGKGLTNNDSLSFSEKNTNIDKALSSIKSVFKNEIAPTVLLTDGNQTLGNDYEFGVSDFGNSIYPLILGDSTKYTDLKIEQLNTNRYAFLKNQFPVEAILVYSGTAPVSAQFLISQGGSTVYRESVSFTELDNTRTLSFTLPANSVGLQRYQAQIVPLQEEKNKSNNTKQFAVEVIDQATNVLVVSKIIHPDLGALRKSISSNEQRTVRFAKPSEAVSLLNDHQLVVLYQPDGTFASLYEEIEKLKKNTFTITGTQTNWDYLNTVQQNFEKEASFQSEFATGVLNRNYGTFAVEDIGFDGFPPLKTAFGTLEVLIPHETILEQAIDGFSSDSPMLATMELNGVRNAIWDGEDLWRWRAQTYLETGDFSAFDEFTGKLVQYLASTKRRSRLEVVGETFYYNNEPIKITAQYFDSNYVFDPRASVTISVVNTETNEQRTFPMLLRSNFYEVDLNSLPAGNYQYTVSVRDEVVTRSGSFTILEFNVEQQFLNADVTKLKRLATNTNGTAFFVSERENLINALLEDQRFVAVQKSEQKVVPLIDWKYLLGLIALLLSLEWFTRKYNGLI